MPIPHLDRLEAFVLDIGNESVEACGARGILMAMRNEESIVSRTLQARALEGASSAVAMPAKMGSRSAKALLAEIRTVLRSGEVYDAQRLAAEAAAKHTEVPGLRRMHELLNVGRTHRRPGTGRSVRHEVDWLRDPPEELRGRWIVVLGPAELVASAGSLNELMTRFPPHQEPEPLILQIEA